LWHEQFDDYEEFVGGELLLDYYTHTHLRF